MSLPNIRQAAPILPSSDFSRTAAFYAGLGFTEQARWAREYLILKLGELELHFFFAPAIDPSKSEFMCYLRAFDTQALFAQYSKLGLPTGCIGAPRVQGPPDGDGEFAVIDPDGTLLRIGRLVGAS